MAKHIQNLCNVYLIFNDCVLNTIIHKRYHKMQSYNNIIYNAHYQKYHELTLLKTNRTR